MKPKNIFLSAVAVLLVLVMLMASVSCTPADSNGTVTSKETGTETENPSTGADGDEKEKKILFIGNSHINVPMLYQQFYAICEQMGRSCQITRLTQDGTLKSDWHHFMDSLTANDPDMFKDYDTVIFQYFDTSDPSEHQQAILDYLGDDVDIYAYYTTIEFEWEYITECEADVKFIADYAATAIMEALCDDSDLILYQDEFDHTTTLYGFYTAMILYYSVFKEACFDAPFIAPLPEYADESDILNARTAAMLTCSLTEEQLRDKEFIDGFVKRLREGDSSVSLAPEIDSTAAPEVKDVIDLSADTPLSIDFIDIPDGEELVIYYLTDSFHDSNDSELYRYFKELCAKKNISVKFKPFMTGYTTMHYPGYSFGEKTMYEHLRGLYDRKNTVFSDCDIVIMQETRGYPMADAAKLIKELFPENARAYYFVSKGDIERAYFGEFAAMNEAGITVVPFGHAAAAYLAAEDDPYLPGLIKEGDYSSVILDEKGSALGSAVLFYTVFGACGDSFESLLPDTADANDAAALVNAMKTVFSMSEERLTDRDAFHQLVKALRFS